MSHGLLHSGQCGHVAAIVFHLCRLRHGHSEDLLVVRCPGRGQGDSRFQNHVQLQTVWVGSFSSLARVIRGVSIHNVASSFTLGHFCGLWNI